MGSDSAPPSRPGILVVHPRLHNPTPENATTFLRWTKLHFRDLLNLPAVDSDGGHVTQAMRFAALDGNERYGQVNGTESKYFYIILSTSTSAFLTPQYYALSRRLDLENTRNLIEGEEPVKSKEGEMVWDIVDARFSVYQELESSESERLGLAKYEGKREEGKTCLVTLSTTVPPQELQSELLGLFEARAPKELKVYTSVYRDAGVDAQPNEHPKIEKDAVGGGDWLVLILVVDEEGCMLKVKHVEMMVEGWVKQQKDQGMEVKFGVWSGEIEVS